MKYLLEMNHFLPMLKTGNTKKSNIKLYDIPENIKEFFSKHDRNQNMISEIHEDETVNIIGNIGIYKDDLIHGKLPIKFGYVSGNFVCQYNDLTSLDGCPQEIGGSFYCNNNNLTSLEGCPREVGRDFSCHHNQLTLLEGCPQEVEGDFSCYNNQLISLEGCPKEVEGNFDCCGNPGNFTEDDVRQYCNVKGKIIV